MAIDEELDDRAAVFRWPDQAPITLEDAWRFLQDNPFPSDRFFLRRDGATARELEEAERALARRLPQVLREALLRHNGIDERRTRSGPFLAGAHELARGRKVRKVTVSTFQLLAGVGRQGFGER